ncbi:MauE/DoxX family redox-associated membrane protein [Salinisphaera orenii]|uniref:Methylamine utilization protein MauE n=1 Tax=Salinisphaera orenii YIM 95161 TaxID=1051139 RepID=A0A423PUZ2_9GAMM|nr:MauE/DoxX family redox-associated membrane protein [Salinisphaera halophila]ROO29352.1 methylamine utilization protein MauE [Salinisphaera halophila YIM 95161]
MIHPIVGLSLSLFLAVILLSAASHKLRARHRFARQIEDYALLPKWTIGAASRLLPIAEVLVALALLVPALRPVGAIAAAVLLAVYTAAITINLIRGRRDIDCGCSGPGLERPLGVPLIVRNAVLLAMAGLVALPASDAALHGFGLFLIVACVAAGLILYTATEGLLANQPRLKSLSGR